MSLSTANKPRSLFENGIVVLEKIELAGIGGFLNNDYGNKKCHHDNDGKYFRESFKEFLQLI
jgi:hypothetical protein